MREVFLGDVLLPNRTAVRLEADTDYSTVGILSYGRGLFARPVVKGGEVSYSTYYRIDTDQFIYSKLFAWEGALTVVPRNFGGYFVSQEFPTFEVKTELASPSYLRMLTTWPEFWERVRAGESGMGGRRKRVHPDRLLTVRIPLPDIEAQARMVDLIESVDEAVGATQRLCVALDASTRSLSVDWFEGQDADIVPLGKLCGTGGIQIGPFGSQLHAHDYVEDGTPTVMPKDIVGNRISDATIARVPPEKVAELSRHRLEPGDIVLPRRGDLTKRALVGEAERGWLCGTGTVRVRVAEIDPMIVYRALTTPSVNAWLADNAVGATMPNLNSGLVAAIPVRIPLGSDAVVDALGEMAAVLTATRVTLSKLESLRLALLSDLLSGSTEISDAYDQLLSAAS